METLIVHGAIVLLLGIVSGVPFWLAIIFDGSNSTVRAWRVAHATLIAAGLMLLVVGLAATQVDLGASARLWLERSLVASAYGFAFALILGALAGERGLNPLPLGVNSVFFLGHLIGAVGSLVGISVFLLGLLR